MKPVKTGMKPVHIALNVLALCFALSVLGRGLGESFTVFLLPISSSFGWDRVIWGSDWPVCTLGGGLTTWVAATQALLAGASESERARLLSGNARRLWRL